MHKLVVNPETLAFCRANLPLTQDNLDYLADALRLSNTTPDLYRVTPPADADVATVSANAANKGGDWSQMVHPTMLAQICVDMAEAMNAPCPDNVQVWHDNGWFPLSFFQPSPPAVQLAPPPPPPAPAPIAATAPGAAMPQANAAAVAQMAAPAPSQAGAPPPPAAVYDPLTYAPAPPAPTQDVAATQAPAPAAAPQIATQEVPASDSFGGLLPTARMVASKGANPLDKDPGGAIPKSAPSRYLRDMADMAPHLFSVAAGDLIGKGNGQAQRHRVMTALFAFADSILASAPDPTVSVELLRYQLQHQRYNASQTAGAATMAAFEAYLLQPTKGE